MNQTPSPTQSPTTAPTTTQSRFLRACLRLPTDRTPVWFLRQAGRYMPEYMAVRRHHTLLEICRTPTIAAEVTITAAERLGVDAAIIFADLLLPFTPMGVDFEFIAGEGPVVHTPIRTLDQVQDLRTDRVEDLLYVARAIQTVARHFAPPRPDGDRLGIIGFCGAPFTLASYMIEGGSSRNYIETKKLMYSSAPATTPGAPSSPTVSSSESGVPASFAGGVQRVGYRAEGSTAFSPNPNPDNPAWPLLMEKLVTVLAAYAEQQVHAGADVIQIFDSWAGALSPTDYTQFCLGPTTRLVQRIQALGVPVILFGVDTASLLPLLRQTGADVIGLDWRIPLDQGWAAVGHGCAIQGNLDPITLFAPPAILQARTEEILNLANHRPGHIFNLGHGIVPGTPVQAVLDVVHYVKNFQPKPTHA